jgi:hypothetical protein
MIAALLALLSFVPVSGAFVPASGKPFIVSWEVQWKPPLTTTAHEKRFRTAEEAVRFEMAAPLCSKKPAPCVMWIHADVVTIDPKSKYAKGGVPCVTDSPCPESS